MSLNKALKILNQVYDTDNDDEIFKVIELIKDYKIISKKVQLMMEHGILNKTNYKYVAKLIRKQQPKVLSDIEDLYSDGYSYNWMDDFIDMLRLLVSD